MSTYEWTALGEYPLVSCIMPTYGRPRLVPESVQMFLSQDYPNKELIIFNDCPGQEYVADLPNVRVINEPSRYASLGEKRNAAIELAKGELIAVWDDDDVYLSWRLSYSVEQMHANQTPFYRPEEYWAYWGESRLVTNRSAPGWISHPATVFHKDLWREAGGYPEITLGEDAALFRTFQDVLGYSLPAYHVSPQNRFFVLRASSPYAHTSISGGKNPPDTTQGEYTIDRLEIQDSTLRETITKLVIRHRSCADRLPADRFDFDNENFTFIDEHIPIKKQSGYGEIGFQGNLGYEGKSVRIMGQDYPHSISAHGDSSLVYRLDGDYEEFRSHVAINDDVVGAEVAADFFVLVDGEVVGLCMNVIPGDFPRVLRADISGASEITLTVKARPWDCCHSVWLDPQVGDHTLAPLPIEDCLARCRIQVPAPMPKAELCIATVGSPGYESWIDDLFGSIVANANCPSAMLAVFFIGQSEEMRRIAEKYRATIIPCEPLKPLSPGTKSILYSAARFIQAAKYICIDADVLVLDRLDGMVAAIDSTPLGSVHICREAVSVKNLEDAMRSLYGGSKEEILELLNGSCESELEYELVVNDGLFAASRAAMLSLDETVRHFFCAVDWVENSSYYTWRNQFILNLAIAKMKSGQELDARFNVQLNYQNVEISRTDGNLIAMEQGRKVSVLHFNGSGRSKYPEWRGLYSQMSSPIQYSGVAPIDYSTFMMALRKWVGQSGVERMAWSFYGTSDGASARLSDPHEFGLYQTLYSLIRSNGCSRVLETGTFRGVSAACCATAIAHRVSPEVVTLDPTIFRERDELWSLLPERARACIDARPQESLTGMRNCLREQETFHAVLLDSVHSREHVIQEFELATQIVCEGGLILVHDPLLRFGTVNEAIDEIVSRGFRAVTLWSAKEGVQEDDGLGLAVIENRQYQSETVY